MSEGNVNTKVLREALFAITGMAFRPERCCWRHQSFRVCVFLTTPNVQAIYGFRGANSRLLQRRFNILYPDTSATYHLSDNYRSRPPIIRVADLIRHVG